MRNKFLLKSQAFTLIELILGLSIFAVVILCIYSTFSGGIHLSRRAESQGDIYRDIRRALDLIDKDLQNAVSYNLTNLYPSQFAFQGEEERITLIVAKDDHLKVVRYYLNEFEEGSIYQVIIGQTYTKNVKVTTESTESSRINYLVREEFDLIDYFSNPAHLAAKKSVVALNIREHSLKFSYADALAEDPDTMVWKNSWARDGLPRRVQAQMIFQLPQKPFTTLAVQKDFFIPQGVLGKSGL